LNVLVHTALRCAHVYGVNVIIAFNEFKCNGCVDTWVRSLSVHDSFGTKGWTVSVHDDFGTCKGEALKTSDDTGDADDAGETR